jgi:translation elongation factor EF-4
LATETHSVFVSYAHNADSQFALMLVEDLKNGGAPAWLDQIDIPPGVEWDREVEHALNNCTHLLVILSPASVDSTNVRNEIHFALNKQKKIIPVLHQRLRGAARHRRESVR